MTEDEARQRWCPFARVPDEGNHATLGSLTATNRHWGDKRGKDGKPRILRKNSMCIASECMAWRWADEPREVGTDIKCEHCDGTGVIGDEECPHCVTGYQVEGIPVGYC